MKLEIVLGSSWKRLWEEKKMMLIKWQAQIYALETSLYYNIEKFVKLTLKQRLS